LLYRHCEGWFSFLIYHAQFPLPEQNLSKKILARLPASMGACLGIEKWNVEMNNKSQIQNPSGKKVREQPLFAPRQNW